MNAEYVIAAGVAAIASLVKPLLTRYFGSPGWPRRGEGGDSDSGYGKSSRGIWSAITWERLIFAALLLLDGVVFFLAREKPASLRWTVFLVVLLLSLQLYGLIRTVNKIEAANRKDREHLKTLGHLLIRLLNKIETDRVMNHTNMGAIQNTLITALDEKTKMIVRNAQETGEQIVEELIGSSSEQRMQDQSTTEPSPNALNPINKDAAKTAELPTESSSVESAIAVDPQPRELPFGPRPAPKRKRTVTKAPRAPQDTATDRHNRRRNVSGSSKID